MASGPSQALKDFRESLELAQRLLELERRYGDPAPQKDSGFVGGLRGGAAVLMVAAFERYVRSVVRERFEELRDRNPAPQFPKLPDHVKVASVFTSLQSALRGPRFGGRSEKKDRLPAVTAAANDAARGILNPSAVAETGGNPNPKTLKSIFRNCDIEDPFDAIRARFASKWGSQVAMNFLPDKLQEIIDRRNEVAHTGSIRGISRHDLRESLRFIRILATALDDELRIKMNTMYKNAR